jgi:hypothetical protein
MTAKKQVVARIKMEVLKGTRIYVEGMPKLVNGHRRTTMSRKFERFVANGIKEGKFPITISKEGLNDHS